MPMNHKNRMRHQKPADQKFRVGIYQLGFTWVELWVDPEYDGGNFQWNPSKCRDAQKPKVHPIITIGVMNMPLWAAWGILCHEVLEATLCELKCRFKPTGGYVDGASDIYTFHFDHNQFTEVAARTGSYLCDCRADFEMAFKRCQKKKAK